jgi:hypothetical protein
MGFIPHPPIYLSLIRIHDIWFLLALGALYEILCRLYLLQIKIKPRHVLKLEAQQKALQKEVDHKRKLGPSAFVETSKLERQLLQLDREIETVRSKRKTQAEATEKLLLRSGNMRLSFLVWILWYSVPILSVDDLEIGLDEYAPAGSFLRNLFFPISASGVGYRISKIGLPVEAALDSLGALFVMWSAQVTVGKLMDAVDAYYINFQ